MQSVAAQPNFYSLSKSVVSVKCWLSITFHIALQSPVWQMNTADSYLHIPLSFFPPPGFGNWIVARLPRQLYAAKFRAGRQIPQHLLYETYSHRKLGTMQEGGPAIKLCAENTSRNKSQRIMRLKLELCKPKSFDSRAEAGKSFYPPATRNELEKLLQYASLPHLLLLLLLSMLSLLGLAVAVVSYESMFVASLHSFLIIDIQ